MREPVYRKGRKAWFVWINGKQTKLATTKKAAYEEWAKLQTEPVNSTAPCVVLFDKFLDWTKANRSERTYDWYQFHLQSFSVSIGKRLTISQLRPHHVSDWVQNVHQGSTNNTIHGAMRAVQRACNWAVKEGYIARSPMGTLEKPSPTSRDTVIPPELWHKMIDLASDQEEQDLLVTMRETGCRPQELRLIEATQFDREERRWIFPVANSKGKRRNRVVYLTDVAFEISIRLAEQNPNGPMFRNSKGDPWTKNAIRLRFRKHKKLGVPELCATIIRHTYTTQALKNGVNPVVLAELLGHVDVTTLSRNYSHLYKDADLLREQATKARGQDHVP